MLNDVRRNEAYKEAISANREYFKNKVVLDVGAGTGMMPRCSFNTFDFERLNFKI